MKVSDEIVALAVALVLIVSAWAAGRSERLAVATAIHPLT